MLMHPVRQIQDHLNYRVMEQLNSKTRHFPKIFFIVGLILLITGIFWGIIGALQYVESGILKSFISFERLRPLHVSSVVFWIILAAIGSVFTYMQEHSGKGIFSKKLMYV